jgi:hypothetical protein
MTVRADDGEGKPPSAGFWRSLFRHSLFNDREAAPPPADPLHCDTPMLRRAEIAAVYTGQRVAGDFYEFLRVSPSRMLFVLLDIAGLRADTREILIAVQETFRTLAPKLFAGEDLNETTAMIELCNEMNLTILRGGLRSCPAFLGCYNEDLGTVCYANAGHTPGLLRDYTGITLLEATGLPLGLFSHTMQARLPVTWCPVRHFWWSRAGSSKLSTSKRTTRVRNLDWTECRKAFRARPHSPRVSYA